MENLTDSFNTLINDVFSPNSWPAQSPAILATIMAIITAQFTRDSNVKYKDDADEVLKMGMMD